MLLILFYWLHFSIVCPKGREGQTAIMKYEWDASLTFGLLSTWKHLIYVLEKRSLEALQGGRTQLQLVQSLDFRELLFDLSCESLEAHLQGCCVWLTQNLSMSNAFSLGEGGGDGVSICWKEEKCRMVFPHPPGTIVTVIRDLPLSVFWVPMSSCCCCCHSCCCQKFAWELGQ